MRSSDSNNAFQAGMWSMTVRPRSAANPAIDIVIKRQIATMAGVARRPAEDRIHHLQDDVGPRMLS